MRLPIFLMVFVAAVALAGCSRQVPAAGDYEGPPLAAHSLETATLDVYLGFTCAPCQQVYLSGAPALAERYGERLRIRNNFVLRDQAVDAPMRLYLVAKDAGKADQVADLLMRAKLPDNDEGKVLILTHWVANQAGLGDAYAKAANDPTMDARIGDAIAATREGLQFMPALVVDRQIMFHDDMANAQTVLESVLKAER